MSESIPTNDITGFYVGQSVIKVSGTYHPPGTYRGFVTTKSGDVRLIVEHDYGMLHIYAPGQIEKLVGNAITGVDQDAEGPDERF